MALSQTGMTWKEFGRLVVEAKYYSEIEINDHDTNEPIKSSTAQLFTLLRGLPKRQINF